MPSWRRSGSRKSFKKSDISKPTQFEHRIHADFDPQTGNIRGLPVQWQSFLGTDVLHSQRPQPIVQNNDSTYPMNHNSNNSIRIVRGDLNTCVNNVNSNIRVVDRNRNINLDCNVDRTNSFTNGNYTVTQQQVPLNCVGQSFSDQATTSDASGREAHFVNKPVITSSDDEFCHTLRSMVSGAGDPRADLGTFTRIECGSTGVVYASYLFSRRRKVAVKCMNIWRQPRRELLFNEVLVARQLRHPNLVETLDTHVVDDELWVIMEFMSGGSLTSLITYKRLEESLIATVCQQCLDALAFLHSRGIIHRDIKSDSILLTDGGVAKLSDFGFCGQLTPECRTRRSILGTPYWFSAQVAAQQPYGTDADVWSFGITVIEMIFGEPPYFNDPPSTAMRKIIELPPARIPSFAKVSLELDSFVNAMLTKEVESRATAAALLRHPFLYSAQSSAAILPLMRDVQRRRMEGGR